MSLRILIADDHAVFRSGLKALLEQDSDLQVVAETGTGHETIRAATDPEVDLLILDIGLPDLRGPRVAEAILRQRPALPIVVLTMYENEHYLRELLKIGVRGFVLKKSTGSDLLQAIRTVRRGERYVDPSLTNHLVDSYVGPPARSNANRQEILTPREKEVCGLLARGHTNAEIAEQLQISVRTVETHRTNLMQKLDARSRADLVRFATEQDLVRLD